ncbi:MAG: HDOD domain-containing protein [Myxococcota bacterium]
MGNEALAVSHAVSEAPDDEELLSEIRRLFSRDDYHPPPTPSVALEVRSAAEREDATIDAVVRILERDTVLAAETLRLAQSPSFASRIPPRTLHEAVARLGLRTLENVVWQATLEAGVFKLKGFEQAMESLRAHSTATAQLARFVAREAKLAKTEHVFLVGLLHDVGVAALVAALADGELPTGSLEEAAPVFDIAHEEAGRLLTRIWRLPAELQVTVGQHHAGDDPTLLAIDVAQYLAAQNGRGLMLAGHVLDEVDEARARAAAEGLGIDLGALEEPATAIVRDTP